MAKVSLNKVLTQKTKPNVNIKIGESEVEVLQYLPIEKKANFISAVMQAAIDDNGIFSPVRIKVYFDLNVIRFYTNFNLTDTMYDEPSKTYDLLVVNNIINEVTKAIPTDELDFVYNALIQCINDVRNYNNSAAGVMKSIVNDYNETNMDVDHLVSELGDPEQFKLVKDVLTKLG